MVEPEPRPGWDQYFQGIAWSVAARGDCRRTQVGAIIVDRSKIIVATGYNGVSPGDPGCLSGACPRGLQTYEEIPAYAEYSNCVGIHAEDNALRFARQAGQNYRLIGAMAYITRAPCDECQWMLRNAGVVRAVYPEGEKCLT
jgi:dCMP deaminase